MKYDFIFKVYFIKNRFVFTIITSINKINNYVFIKYSILCCFFFIFKTIFVIVTVITYSYFFLFNHLKSFKLFLFLLFLLSKFKDFDKILFSPVFYNTLSFLLELYKIINIFILVFLLIIFLLKNYKNKYSFFVLPVIGKGKKVEKEQVVTEDTGSGFEIFGFWRYSKKKSTTVYVNEDLKKFEETSVSHGSFSPKLEKTFKAEKAENAENGFEVTKTVSVTPSNFLSSFSKNNTPEEASLPSAISTVEYLLL